MADLTLERKPLSSLLEPLRVGTAATIGLLLHSAQHRLQPAVAVIALLLLAQAWTPGVDRDVRSSLVAGSMLIPAAAAWDTGIAAIMLAAIMLQGSWIAYGGALLAISGMMLLNDPAWGQLPEVIGPSAIMAAGMLASERQHRQQLSLREHLNEARRSTEQAREMNDTVIQNIAGSVWANQNKDYEEALRLGEDALENARALVERLQKPSGAKKGQA